MHRDSAITPKISDLKESSKILEWALCPARMLEYDQTLAIYVQRNNVKAYHCFINVSNNFFCFVIS